MDVLEKLFSSDTLVRTLRLFLLHPHEVFDVDMVALRIRAPRAKVHYELDLLKSVGFLKRGSFWKETETAKGPKHVRRQGLTIDTQFIYLDGLRQLIVGTELIEREELTRIIKRFGDVRLAIVSGVFLRQEEARVDLLLVGTKLGNRQVEAGVESIESRLGAELEYVILSPDDFTYRMQVRDRLLRDIFGMPYTVLLNTARIELPEVGTF